MNFSLVDTSVAVIEVSVLSLLLALVLRRFLSGRKLVLITVPSVAAVATLLYALGSAGAGPPDLLGSFAQYGAAGLVVMVVWLFIQGQRGKANG